MISMNFNTFASLAIFFIIPVFFCFGSEHETMYTIRVWAVFDFYYRTHAGNITESENLQNSNCPFRFLAWEKSRKRSDIAQFGRWRDSLSSALYALYSDLACSFNQWQRALYPNLTDMRRARGLVRSCQHLSTLKYSQGFVNYFHIFPRSLKAELLLFM